MDSHLCVEFYSGQRRLGQYDFSVHEFIPLVRQVTREIAGRAGMAERLQGYRAFIVPRTEGSLSEQEYIWKNPAEQATDSASVPLRIAIDDDAGEKKVSYNEEIQAYFDAGTSALCHRCPERSRCPGSGLAPPTTDLGDWIQLRADDLPTGATIRYFSLEIIEKNGTRLFAKDFLPEVLHTMVQVASEPFIRELVYSGLPPEGKLRGAFTLMPGQAYPPQVLTQPRHVRVRVSEPSDDPRTIERGPVDWSRIRSRRAPEDVLPVGRAETGLRTAFRETYQVGIPTEEMNMLTSRLMGNQLAELGLILGRQARDAGTGDMWITVSQFSPLIAAAGSASILFNPMAVPIRQAANLASLLPVIGGMFAGWYRLDSSERQGRGARGGQLFTPQEIDMHLTLFPEPWQIAYVGSLTDGTACCYRYASGSMVRVPTQVVKIETLR
jgi:hypothetical protein